MTKLAVDQDNSNQGITPALGIALIAVVYLIPIMWGLASIGDADLWWHLSVGEWVVNHGTVPTNDPFSQYGADKEWVAYSWLFEVVLYKLYSWFGLCGVFIYRAGIPLLVIIALHRMISAREPRFILSLFLTGLAAFALTPLFQERPWLVSILFAILTQMTVLALRGGRRTTLLWLLPFIYIIWANVHIQFVYGFLLLGIGCGAPLLERFWRTERTENADTAFSSGWWKLVTVSIVCALATLINPYHVRIYQVVPQYGSQTWAFDVVQELQAFTFRHHWSWCTLALAMLTAFRLGSKDKISFYELLLLIACAFFSFRAQRDLWMIILAAFTILPGIKLGAQEQESFAMTSGRWCMVTLIVALGTIGFIFAKRINNENLEASVKERFPYALTEHIREHKYEGPLYNDFNWGGYLIWRLPNYKVALDGRTNLHGGERVKRSVQQTWAATPEWKDDPELKSANLVVASIKSPLVSVLRLSPDFKSVYEDEIGIIFLRSAPMR